MKIDDVKKICSEISGKYPFGWNKENFPITSKAILEQNISICSSLSQLIRYTLFKKGFRSVLVSIDEGIHHGVITIIDNQILFIDVNTGNQIENSEYPYPHYKWNPNPDIFLLKDIPFNWIEERKKERRSIIIKNKAPKKHSEFLNGTHTLHPIKYKDSSLFFKALIEGAIINNFPKNHPFYIILKSNKKINSCLNLEKNNNNPLDAIETEATLL